MIRRGFWLVVGAAGGIIGYRRVVMLGRRASGTIGAGRASAENASAENASAENASAKKRRWVRETIRFTRDVRKGMDLYMARHPHQVGPTLDAVSPRGDDPPEPPGCAPDGKDRHFVGHAGGGVHADDGVRADDDVDVDDVKDDR